MALSKTKQEIVDYTIQEQRKLMVEMIDQVFKYLDDRQPKEVSEIGLENILHRLEVAEQRISSTSDRVALSKGFGITK